jgi:predicted transcriptional regulator
MHPDVGGDPTIRYGMNAVRRLESRFDARNEIRSHIGESGEPPDMSWSAPDVSPDGVVAALEKRARLLRMLADGPMDKPALRDALDVSRSTVYKALRELEELGLVHRVDDGYALTQFGRLARRKHDEFRATVGRLCDATDVLGAVPDGCLLPVSFVERGRVVGATRHAPERPMAAYESVAADAGRMRVLSGVAMPRYLPRLHERVVERGDLAVDLVVTEAASEYLESYDEFHALQATDDFRAFRTGREVPFGLTVFDDRGAALAAHTDQGSLRGLLLSDAPASVAWSEHVFREFRETATMA